MEGGYRALVVDGERTELEDDEEVVVNGEEKVERDDVEGEKKQGG